MKYHIGSIPPACDLQDESYTPKRVSVRAGRCFDTLSEIESVGFQEPDGWQEIQLHDMFVRGVQDPLKTFCLQVCKTPGSALSSCACVLNLAASGSVQPLLR